MGERDAFAVSAVVLGVVLVSALLYGVLIYNHTQDVNRDKFLIEHCIKVQSDKENVLNGSQTFTCGATK